MAPEFDPEEVSRKRKRSEQEKKTLSAKHKRVKASGEAHEDTDSDDHGVSAKNPSNEGVMEQKINADGSGTSEEPLTNATNGQQARTGKQERARRRMKKRSQKQRDPTAVTPTQQKRTTAWAATRPTGGRFLGHDALFSKDEQFLFAANGREVLVMSIADSLVEWTIPAPEAYSVSSFALSTTNPLHLYVAFTSGTVQCWDWSTKSVVRISEEFPGQITEIALGAATAEGNDALYSVTSANDEWQIHKDSTPIYKSSKVLRSLQILGDYVLAASNDVLVVGKRENLQGKVDNTSGYRFIELPTGGDITCLASRLQAVIAPSKSKSSPHATLAVAVGNSTGEIYVFDDISTIHSTKVPAEKPSLSTPRTLHWHREAVETIKWSNDGTYLISGGRETVLVIWQLATGKKQFLPHLTAEIEKLTVSPSGSSYAVQLADNSIMVLSTSELKPIANFAGVQIPYLGGVASSDQPESCGIIAATLRPSRMDELLIAVPPSSPRTAVDAETSAAPFLQTYDILSNRHLSRQALTRNNITDFNRGPEGNKIREPNVAFIQTSFDGEWLATIEEWEPPSSDTTFLSGNSAINGEERSTRREVYLKIWRWNQEKGHWALVTRIDAPHSSTTETKSGKVFALVTDPMEVGFATIGEDSRIRVWKPKSRFRNGTVIRGASSDALVDWYCRHTTQLELNWEFTESISQHASSQAPTRACIAYSDDGSVIAASQTFQGSSAPPPVHFIQTETGNLAQSRSALYTGAIAALNFVGRYLVILSSSGMNVWDVVMETLSYRTELSKLEQSSLLGRTPRMLAVSREDATFAVSTAWAHAASRIEVFSPESHRPVFTHDVPSVITSVLAVGGRKGYTVLTSDAEIFTVSSTSSLSVAGASRTQEQSALVAVSDPEEQDDDVEMESSSDIENRPVAMLEEPDSERPVVRPEQLARIFDTGALASMPVRAMFEAVVGLYGRKPVAPSVV